MTRIMYFIGSLRSGGTERRLIELLTYLNGKECYELLVVLAYRRIDYSAFSELGIPHKILDKRPKIKDPVIFSQIHKICKEFNPDVIHTWGNMQTFYTIPTSVLRKVPIINSQIASVNPVRNFLSFGEITRRINFAFSTIVTSNSRAGLKELNLKENQKYRVIPNGLNLERFNNLPPAAIIKNKFRVKTKFTVLMAARFSIKKDHKKYLQVCKYVQHTDKDITFFAAGDGINLAKMKQFAKDLRLDNIQFTGRIDNIEELISICDIGVLLSNSNVHGEGISNSILEYMVLEKPVIANDTGGTNEIIKHNTNGYLINNESADEIARLLVDLIHDKNKRKTFGENGKKMVHTLFTLPKMGEEFEKLYEEARKINEGNRNI